jgi:hypothetical protein
VIYVHDMRKEAACMVLLGVLWLGASTAHASPAVLADWTFDEGSGQVATDASGHGNDGQLGASTGSDTADPAWIDGHSGAHALGFDGSQYVSIPDSGALEPAHVAVHAWVRNDGSPGRFRYVLSKGSVGCDRSAYGLYSGWGGGIAFYVSSSTVYFISPEAPTATVWDGHWHHVIGSYDGGSVRLWIDGASVGTGTATNVGIAYGNGSKGIYIGMYRGSCDLGFNGLIDDVQVWDDPPAQASAPGPVVQPVPGTPTQVTVGGRGPSGGSSQQSGSTTTTGTKTTPRACLKVTLSRRTVPIKRRALVLATVRRSKKRVAGVKVVVQGEGVHANARTNRKGTARIVVRARKAGRLTVLVRGQKAGCPSSSVRAR